MNVAVIPARGGSKRIPGKNIREFSGKPMIAYSILAAQKSCLFDHVIVSTDSDEIAKMALAWGAEVPFRRPPDLADDFVGTDAVFLHGISMGEQFFGPVEYACCLHATAPFMSVCHLQEGFKLIQTAKVASVFAVTTFPAPIFRALRISDKNQLSWQWPEFSETRSQDLPEVVHDAGQFYWVDVKKFKETPDMLHQALPVILPRWSVQDIDTEEDWEVAEKMFHLLHPAGLPGNPNK
jgi:pseudaminic acid cytidylyltransferase